MRKPAAVLFVLSLAVLALALVPAAGLAAKGGNAGAHGGGGGGGKPVGGGSTGGGTISLAQPLVYDANGNGLPNVGDVVMFDVSTTATDQPFVNLKCFQNGVLVANAGKAISTDLSTGPGASGSVPGRGWAGPPNAPRGLDMYTRQGWKQLAAHELPRRRVETEPRKRTTRGPGFRRGLSRQLNSDRSFFDQSVIVSVDVSHRSVGSVRALSS